MTIKEIKSVSCEGAINVIFTLVALSFFLFSCGGVKKEMVEITFDPQTSYTLKETNIETFVSDSGITRYKVNTATWLIYGKAKEPYWYFPDGVYLEKFDTLFNIEASVKADTAFYYERRKLWRLAGDVDVSNMEGVRFETQELYWDQNKETIYSDSFIKISEGQKINTGIGFKSDQNMNVWEIYNSGAEFPIEVSKKDTTSVSIDSTVTVIDADSVKVSNDSSKE